jgi:hypothetical protein
MGKVNLISFWTFHILRPAFTDTLEEVGEFLTVGSFTGKISNDSPNSPVYFLSAKLINFGFGFYDKN